MTDNSDAVPLESERRKSLARPPKEHNMANSTRPQDPKQLEPNYVGAEPLDGSGFETEESESEFTESIESTED
jgi:hypothetical protein